MNKLKMQTPNLIDENVAKIVGLFPEVATEMQDSAGNIIKGIDFDLLKQKLTNVLVEGSDERYRLDWPGKRASMLKANTPINKTLRPVIEDSVDFENTENLYIEGDNFEVLKILQESYLGNVKMIYIDPPYNTGNDFIYKDNFKKSEDDYQEGIALFDVDGGKLFKNTDTNGRFHSDWLCMMYERLVVARDLLKEDGVIFISIDDNEVHNLRKICDEVFGEVNFVAQISWRRSDNQANIGNIARVKEHILSYSKNCSNFSLNKLPLSEKALHEYRYKDDRGKFRRSILLHKTRGRHKFDVVTKNGNILSGPWMIPEYDFYAMDKNGDIYWTSGGQEQPYGKIYLTQSTGQIPNDFWGIEFGTNQRASLEVEEIFEQRYFDFPKPTSLIKSLLNIGLNSDGLVLDFFSGSATTAHAVMQLNAEDGGRRKFIMVQLPEEVDENSEAFKARYKTICDIGKERIRRAGSKIKSEYLQKYEMELEEINNKLDMQNLLDDSELVEQKVAIEKKIAHIKKMDTGFRVYRTDTSNMKDVFYHPSEIRQDMLLDLESNIKEDRTPEDLLTQVILDLGLELSLPISKQKLCGNDVYFVLQNSLVACFDDSINFSVVDEIAKVKPLRVVFKDSSFKDDKDKINLENRFKELSLETVISVL